MKLFFLFKWKRVWQKQVESGVQQLTSGAVSSAFILYVSLHLVLTLCLSVVLIGCPNIKGRIQSNIIPPKSDVIYHTTEISRGMRDSGESLSFCNTLRQNFLQVRDCKGHFCKIGVMHWKLQKHLLLAEISQLHELDTNLR